MNKLSGIVGGNGELDLLTDEMSSSNSNYKHII